MTNLQASTPEFELRLLLANAPVQLSRAVAVRSALRVVPVAVAHLPEEYWLPLLRACLVSWAISRYSLDGFTVSAQSAADAAAAALSSARRNTDHLLKSAVRTLSAARYASRAAAAEVATTTADFAVRTVSAAISAADVFSENLKASELGMFDAVWMAEDRDSDSIKQIWHLPLWQGEIPRWASDSWWKLSGVNVNIAKNYHHIYSWYKVLLRSPHSGVEYFDREVAERIAAQPDTWWLRPPEQVNADIAAWLEESQESAVDVPAPEPGLIGTIDTDGRIGFALSGEATAEELADVSGLLEVLTGATEDLAALLVGNNSVAIAPSIVPQYLACLRADAISIDMLYALGVRLGNARAKLQKQIDSKDYPDLAPDVAELLDSVLELHGPFLLSTAKGRRLVDASSDYLRTAADNAALKRAAMNYGQAVAYSPDLFNKEARELLPQLNEDVDTGPHPERSTQVAMSASRNLLITVARVALQEVLKEGFLGSTQGTALVGLTAFTIQAAWSFLTSYLPVISELAIASGPYLQWIEPLLRKAERRLRK